MNKLRNVLFIQKFGKYPRRWDLEWIFYIFWRWGREWPLKILTVLDGKLCPKMRKFHIFQEKLDTLLLFIKSLKDLRMRKFLVTYILNFCIKVALCFPSEINPYDVSYYEARFRQMDKLISNNKFLSFAKIVYLPCTMSL